MLPPLLLSSVLSLFLGSGLDRDCIGVYRDRVWDSIGLLISI